MGRLETFESLLRECRSAVERTVFFRISVRADAEDVLQEVYLTAYRRFDTLTDQLAFKAWIISIARNKCVDYYRHRAARAEIPMEMLSERVMTYGRCGPREETVVRETLAQLAQKDQSILKLYYFQELTQEEIAEKLQIPIGTVKSRLHTARKNFRELYPKPKRERGEEGKLGEIQPMISGTVDEKIEKHQKLSYRQAEITDKKIEKYPMDENIIQENYQVAIKSKDITESKHEDLKNMDNTNKAHMNSAEKENFMGEKNENKTKVNGVAPNGAVVKGTRSNGNTTTEITADMGKDTGEKTAISNMEAKIVMENTETKNMTGNIGAKAARKIALTKTTILPEFLPDYTITKSQEAPFETVWEELQGWMIVPRLGETLTWGLYELPSRKRTEYTELAVTGRAEVHGIEGVEIIAVQYDAEDYYRTGSVNELERRFVAQLTDTHSRYLAESHMEDGVRKCYTFLDGDSFMNNWGFGEDNCGNEIHVKAKGILRRDGADIICQADCEKSNDHGSVKPVSECNHGQDNHEQSDYGQIDYEQNNHGQSDYGQNDYEQNNYGKNSHGQNNHAQNNCEQNNHETTKCGQNNLGCDCAANEFKFSTLDVVGRYTVTIAGKSYDTICVMDVESFDDAIVTESYIDRNGRTVLWRRFNHDDWAIERFGGKKWSEMLPENEKITVDGSIYVHWYDCISDYIL